MEEGVKMGVVGDGDGRSLLRSLFKRLKEGLKKKLFVRKKDILVVFLMISFDKLVMGVL